MYGQSHQPVVGWSLLSQTHSWLGQSFHRCIQGPFRPSQHIPWSGTCRSGSSSAHFSAPKEGSRCSLLPPLASRPLATMEGCLLRSKGKALLLLCGQANKPMALKSQGGCAQAGMGSLKALPPPSLAVFVNSTLPPRSAAFALSVGKPEEGGLLPESSEGCFQVLLSLWAYLGAECRLGAESRGGLPGKSLPFEAVSWGAATGKPQNVLLSLGHVFIQVASGKNEQQGKDWREKEAPKGSIGPFSGLGPAIATYRVSFFPSPFDHQRRTRWPFCLSPFCCASASEATGMTRDPAHLAPPPSNKMH